MGNLDDTRTITQPVTQRMLGKFYSRSILGLLLKSTLVISFTNSLASASGDNYYDLSLEELADLPVVESSKPSTELFDAPNSSFVFNEDAIRNLPVDSIPELLRYAPGTHIMHSSNGTWGLAIRGMNSRFLGRTLFTVDEQSLYGTIFNGLYGNDHDLLLDDVASVEVVYGPGGSLWGSNAANGRVNVLLKTAFETEGTALKAKAGTHNRSIDARHGWLVGEKAAARVWLKKSDRQSSSEGFEDDWDSSRAGIRYDFRPDSENLLSITAEVSDSDLGSAREVLEFETGLPKIIIGAETQSGMNTQAKWTHEASLNNGYSIRAWSGITEFRSLNVNYDLQLFGTELKWKYSPAEQHKFVFSTGIISYDKKLINSKETTFAKDYKSTDSNANLGGEYTFTITPKQLQFSIGLNGSYDSFTKAVTPLPSARIMFSPKENSRAWIAYSSSSRAIASALTEVEHMISSYLPVGPLEIPTPFGVFNIDTQLLNLTNNRFKMIEKERLDAIEIGYRIEQENGGSLSVTAFTNRYENIMGLRDYKITPILNVQSPFLLNQIIFDNIADGESYGMELSKLWLLSKKQDLTFNYSFISDRFEALEHYQSEIEALPFLQAEIATLNNNVPTHQASLWHSYKFENWRTDIGLRYNSEYNSLRSSKDETLQCDIRFSWSKSDNIRFSIVGRNLFKSETNETFLKDYIGRGSSVPREAYLEMDLTF